MPMRIAGETEHPVPALELPATDRPEDVEASPSGASFLARARAIGRLSSIDASAFLRRLDGLPLAIELAAARTRILAPGAILRPHDPGWLPSFCPSALPWTEWTIRVADDAIEDLIHRGKK